MSNRKKVKVEKEFLTILKDKFEGDNKSVDQLLYNQNWQSRFAEFINQFIQGELVQYDKDLYQKVYHLNGGKYPSSRTILRAFIKEEEASVDLLNVCGWYIFKENWKIESKRFDFAQKINTNDLKSQATQATNIEAGEDLKLKVKNTSAKIDNVKAGRNIDIDITRD